jgi:hypothetical protein
MVSTIARHPLGRLGALCALILALAGSCEMFSFPLDKFHAEQTGGVKIRAVPEIEGQGEVVQAEDGYICIEPEPGQGSTTIIIPVDNPAGLAFMEKGLIDTKNLPPGVVATARQTEDRGAIEISISGAAEGAEFSLPLTIKTAEEGRLLAEMELNLAFISFETRLSTLEVAGYTLVPGWAPDRSAYAVDEVPVNIARVRAEAISGHALVSINGEGSVAAAEADIPLSLGKSDDVEVLVSAPHEVASRTYKLKITRLQAAENAKSIAAFTLAGIRVTALHDPVRGGIDEDALTISVIVPPGTDLRALTPAVAHTGVAYTPREPRDFRAPVEYTVIAQDGSRRTYIVTVAIEPPVTETPVEPPVEPPEETPVEPPIVEPPIKPPVIEHQIIINTITEWNIPSLSFEPDSITVVNGGDTIALNGNQTARWFVKIGEGNFIDKGDTASFTFEAPPEEGFYNVAVIASVDGINYAGNFVIKVE